MEYVAPLLEAVVAVRLRLENGEALSEILDDEKSLQASDLGPEILRLKLLHHQLRAPDEFLIGIRRPQRHAFYEILWFGLKGRPILVELRALEDEVHRAAVQRMEKFLAHMPVQVLLVVIFFQIPAFMLLILGPLLKEIMGGLV